MDLQALADRLGFELDEFSELAELLVETGTAELEGLRVAVAAGDAETVAKMAHSLKGAAGNLGFLKIYELAQGLDQSARDGRLGGAGDFLRAIEGELTRLKELVAGA